MYWPTSTMPDRVPLEIHETREEGWTSLKLTGDLDLATVPELQRRFESVRARGSAIQLDLSEIEFIDSSGMAFLIRASQAAKTQGWRLGIHREVAPQVQRVVELTGLAPLIFDENPVAP
jgi:anti-sigma B factor antagonist